MFQACELDAREEFNLTLANCESIGNEAERDACREEALDVEAEENALCGEQRAWRLAVCGLLAESRYDPDPLLDPANEFIHPDTVPSKPNPYLSLAAGRVSVLRAGEDAEELVVSLNTNETREIQGVACRVVAEVAVEEAEEDGEYEYVPVEVTYDYFALTAADGDVIYCGENTVEYEDGYPVSTDGTFIAGVAFAKAGTLLRGKPKVGDADRQEYALEEAEDVVVYMGVDVAPFQGFDNGAFPCAGKCLQTVDLSPLEPGAVEVKQYRPGTGVVLALPFELNGGGGFAWTGEREELVCQGGSLQVLEDGGCGIGDPEELLRTLCNIAGDAFCPE
jgi:hypothetical protein